MATNSNNRSWNLETFLDSLIYELDKAQDTLSVKGMNRKLTYTVKDVSLDLQIFPEFDGETVRFITAQPGETGASKVTFQLGSIRDHQIQEVARKPLTRNDISLEEVPLPEPEKKELKKLGIRSAEDLRRTIEEQNVDIEKVTDNKVDYQGLANLINQSSRKKLAPTVSKASLSQAQGKTIITLEGENLAIAQSLDQFPVAAINNEQVEVISANPKELKIQVNNTHLQDKESQLKIALDPYAIVTMNLQMGEQGTGNRKKETV
ncbi:hypothetical protein H6G80_30230 [Nostoc sp. FACHB-87]|uniref:hypothetical protein n=1 Tax=Nostocaceae TaxID=1162 RepID=UPI00168A0A59|nr:MULTISPECIES: hypothetical protein [Nostocaceae]MBD2458332.1 hypothetical protein [Nostoc sp. FACHB-87]MBD2479357.1 hypothetical protein [Anabaena sp. FACHB-83]